MAPQWRRQHRSGVDDIFDQHLLPAFGDKLLSAVTKADVLAFRAALAERPGRSGRKLSPARINKIMTILRQFMNEASERFALPDALKGIKRLKARRPDIQPFSLEEVERIRASIRADFANYVTVRFFTGLRTGEVNGLKWKYIDFEKNLILVRETFSAGEAEENAKTETSLRDIPMLPLVKQALQAQWAQRHPNSDYVFCSREGNPIDANNFARRVWYPLLRYLELDGRRPYQTRHTTATLMLASGENPEWIAKLMGHASTQMLFTVYSRFVPNLTRQDGLAITGLLNSKVPAATTDKPDAALLATLKSLPSDQLDALLRLART
jgi:integrase